jgi:hypothetical protein
MTKLRPLPYRHQQRDTEPLRILAAVYPVTGTWSHSDHKFTVGLHHNEHVMTSNAATFQENALCHNYTDHNVERLAK